MDNTRPEISCRAQINPKTGEVLVLYVGQMPNTQQAESLIKLLRSATETWVFENSIEVVESEGILGVPMPVDTNKKTS